MRKKITSIILITALMAGMLIALTACVDNQENLNNEEVIKNYIKAINQRDFDKILKLYDINEMNNCAKEYLETDGEVTENLLKINWEKYFEAMEEYNVSLKIVGNITKISSKDDLEKMYAEMNESASEDSKISDSEIDTAWENMEGMAKAYNLYYIILNRTDSDEERQTSTAIVLDNNGKIVNDSAMYYVLSTYAFKSAQ